MTPTPAQLAHWAKLAAMARTGAQARAAKLTPERRQEIAAKGGRMRKRK